MLELHCGNDEHIVDEFRQPFVEVMLAYFISSTMILIVECKISLILEDSKQFTL
jgi:hypothetical protein